MQDDDVIQFLNSQGGPKFKQQKQPTLDKGNNEIESNLIEGLQQGQQIPFAENFQTLYEDRMVKVQKKNQKKQLEERKRQQLIEAAKKKYPEPKLLTGDQPIKLPTIRHLVFKNWSGNHLSYQVNDNGYKFRFTNGVVSLVKHLLEENGFIESTNNEGTILWSNGVVAPNVYQSLSAYQKINHFPKSFQITRKDLMLQNLSKMKHRHPSHYSFFPKTYILPAESSLFLEETDKNKKLDKWYIVKPHNKSQGRGIWLSNNPDQILKKQKDCIVVSEYVHNPLLVDNLKFDMRIYVAITCWNPLRIYIYDDGLARFATQKYNSDLSSKENLFVHLTNYSLNKFSENFVPNDEPEDSCKGHKWSLPALREYFRSNNYDVDLIWNRIEDMIVKTIISIENTVYNAMEMSVPYRDNCFEVLGFDVLLDDALRPWLLEINLSPSLNTDSALDLKIKGNMLADLFTMMGVVPLDQRFSVDKTYLLNSNKMFTSKEFKNEWVKLERLVIKQSEQETKRSGGWKRAFPTQTAIRYKTLFDVDRPLNRLLRDQELKKLKQTKSGTYNQAIKQISINPQNVLTIQKNQKGSAPSRQSNSQLSNGRKQGAFEGVFSNIKKAFGN